MAKTFGRLGATVAEPRVMKDEAIEGRKMLAWRIAGRSLGTALVICLAVVCQFGCAQETWESAMSAGQEALQEGDYDRAERIFSAALVKAKAFGDEDRRLALSLTSLAQTNQLQGDLTEAESLYARALKVMQDAEGSDHLDVAAILNNLGVLNRLHGQYAEAEQYLTRALAIKEGALGPEHLEVALGNDNLARVYVSQARYDKAEPLYQKSLVIREKALGPDHPDVAESLKRYAAMLRKTNRFEDAARHEARANAITRKARASEDS